MELLLRYSQLSKSCCERENHWWWQWWLPFPSNINIPAWSLFSPRGKSLFHFESSLWMLEMFPWYFPLLVYLLVSRWCANLSHQAQTALFPQSKGQNNCHGRDGRVCVCVWGGGVDRPHSVLFVWQTTRGNRYCSQHIQSNVPVRFGDFARYFLISDFCLKIHFCRYKSQTAAAQKIIWSL